MPIYKRTSLYLAVARRSCSLLAGLALASNAMALGLGDIKGSSYLGQPLKAFIDIEKGNDDYSADEVRVGMIGTAEAQRLGIDIVDGYQNYVLTPVMRNGRLMIDLTTREPVNEPYLNVVVELRWPEGRVFREYSLLLDPVSYSRPMQTDAAGPMVTTVDTAASALANSRPTRAVSQPVKPTIALNGGQSYQVLPGDTLSKIASRMADTAGRSREQLMAVLLANNPRAFIGGDQHKLMAGARLYLPTGSELQAQVDPQPASASITVGEATKPLKTEAERLTVFTPPSKASQRFDAPDSQAEVIAQLSDQLAVTNEIIEKLRLDNKSMRSRLVMLEKSDYLKNLEQLLLLKDQEIDALQQRLANEDIAVAALPAAPIAQLSAVSAPSVQVPAAASPAAQPEELQTADTGNAVATSTTMLNMALKALFGLCILGAGFFLFRMRKTYQLLQQKAVQPVSDETLLQELEDNIDAYADIDDDQQPPSSSEEPQPAQTKETVESPVIRPTLSAIPAANPMTRNRRPDEEVKDSIQQKMRGYQPQLREHNGVENYELDELIEDATAMANRGSFDVAEAILMAEYSEQSRQTGVIDVKLKRTLDMIANMRKGQRAAY